MYFVLCSGFLAAIVSGDRKINTPQLENMCVCVWGLLAKAIVSQ